MTNEEFIKSLEPLDDQFYTSTDVLKRAAKSELISLEEYKSELEEVI